MDPSIHQYVGIMHTIIARYVGVSVSMTSNDLNSMWIGESHVSGLDERWIKEIPRSSYMGSAMCRKLEVGAT